MGTTRIKRARDRRRGTSMIEVTLMAPWILVLFMGILDFGFYSYGLIAAENAARVAVLHSSASSAAAADSTSACALVLNEMKFLPNTRTLTGCGALPLVVTATLIPADNSESADSLAASSRVTVQYQSVQLFPIPGVTGRLTVTRWAQMRVEPD